MAAFVHILGNRVVTVVENWQRQAKKVMGNFLKPNAWTGSKSM